MIFKGKRVTYRSAAFIRLAGDRNNKHLTDDGVNNGEKIAVLFVTSQREFHCPKVYFGQNGPPTENKSNVPAPKLHDAGLFTIFLNSCHETKTSNQPIVA